VSKTINLRKSATEEDVREAFMLAWKLGCKGITVYREGSKREQPLSLPESRSKEVCPDCGAVLGTAEGSIVCIRCGFSDRE
jgi:ribonucleoside-diphosphate reductase alpha chain